MRAFAVPARAEVSAANKRLFDYLNEHLGSIPNLYAVFACSQYALGSYLQLQRREDSLTAQQREVISLIVSQVNDSAYCLRAHTMIAKLNGFTDEQIMEIRTGSAAFDPALHALAKLTKRMVVSRGKAEADELLAAGLTRENLVDVVLAIGDTTISNYMYKLSEIPIDFPEAPATD